MIIHNMILSIVNSIPNEAMVGDEVGCLNRKMKLLVLHLIQQQPKHGYEIIKEISDLVGGAIPQVQDDLSNPDHLEEIGFVHAENTEGDRKQYQITDAGKLHLKEQHAISNTY
jgi:DNA-binding PadR family transcriptional regulator